jgi:hypothetical protein
MLQTEPFDLDCLENLRYKLPAQNKKYRKRFLWIKPKYLTFLKTPEEAEKFFNGIEERHQEYMKLKKFRRI